MKKPKFYYKGWRMMTVNVRNGKPIHSLVKEVNGVRIKLSHVNEQKVRDMANNIHWVFEVPVI